MVKKWLRFNGLGHVRPVGVSQDLFPLRVVLGAAAAVGSVAVAETPSPVLFGVDRVAIACETDSTLTAGQRRSLCEQLAKKAQALTDLPVTIATTGDTQPISGDRLKQRSQLLLRVSAKGRDIARGRKALTLDVTPVRSVGGPVAAPLRSTASFVQVRDAWILQGPVDAFTKLLGPTSRKLRKPIPSDG
jgi:hypothetical protein